MCFEKGEEYLCPELSLIYVEPCPSSLTSVNPSSRTSPAAGETFNVRASAERPDCRFSVGSNRSWIGVSASRVNGDGTVSITVDPNDGPQRSGTVTIGGRSLSITQANGCPASPDGVPSRLNFGSSGESQTVTLNEDAGCPYAVETDDVWITVRPASVAGNGTVTVEVMAHTGPERMGTVTIGAASVQVTQANGCPASPGGVPGTRDYGSSAESQDVTLTEDAGCPYPVATDAAWITVDPASVAGNGTVAILVTAHTGPERMGTVTIGAASVQVTQAAGWSGIAGRGAGHPGLREQRRVAGRDSDRRRRVPLSRRRPTPPGSRSTRPARRAMAR